MQHSFLARRSFWLLPGSLLALVALLSLVACAPAGGATGGNGSQATATATANQGTLNGDVVAAPSCPVESPERPCPPRPVANRQVTIVGPDGKVAVTVTTDKNGHFSVKLDPGVYVLRLVPGTSPFPLQRQPTTVTIVAGKTTSVQIVLDSGIR